MFELCYLISDSLSMLFRWTLRWLSLWSNERVSIQMMTNEIWVYPRGFVCIACEHINIFPEKFNQLLSFQ